MIDVIIIGLLGSLIFICLYKQQQEQRRTAEAKFKATMLALEEKAKQEGTFVQSYFSEKE